MVWFLMDLDIFRGFGFWMAKSDGFVLLPSLIKFKKSSLSPKEKVQKELRNFLYKYKQRKTLHESQGTGFGMIQRPSAQQFPLPDIRRFQ